MPTYKAPVDEVQFLLSDVFHVERYANLPGFSELTPDVVGAVFDEAAKLTENVLAPLNRVGDIEGCKRHDDGRVTTPTGFKDAYNQMREGGWIGRRHQQASHRVFNDLGQAADPRGDYR